MIKTIEIENFQSHRYTILDLHPGVNVIRGRSHSGKSCITRALRWCLLNEPQGFRFKPWSAKAKDISRVSVEFTEGTFVTRQRSNAKNEYIVGEEHLEAMRAEVPEEVRNVSLMSSINLQTQADQFYLLRGSPGAAARELNERVGLTIIDEKLTKAASILRTCSAKLKSDRDELFKTEGALQQYKNLDKHLALIQEIEERIEHAFHLFAKADVLHSLLKQIKESEQEMEELASWFPVKEEVRELVDRINRQKILILQVQGIRGLVQKIAEAEAERNELGILVELSATVKHLLQRAIKQRNKSKETATLIRSIRSCCADMQRVKKQGQDAWAKLRMLKADRDILIEKNKKDFCDKCGAHRSYWREVKV